MPLVTLTDIMPSLRTMISDPLDLDQWPERTVSTPVDVVVSGVSLLRLADLCGTPCVHTADAVIPNTRGRRSPTEITTTVVVRVASVSRHPQGALMVTVDADLSSVDARFDEVRLIGRVSMSRDVTCFLTNTCGSRESSAPFQRLGTGLPGDLAVGDLLALPCRGLVTLHDVRIAC